MTATHTQHQGSVGIHRLDDELIEETLNFLPILPMTDFRKWIVETISDLSDIAENMKWRGVTKERAISDSRSPTVIAYRVLLFKYFPNRPCHHPRAIRYFDRLIEITSGSPVRMNHGNL